MESLLAGLSQNAKIQVYPYPNHPNPGFSTQSQKSNIQDVYNIKYPAGVFNQSLGESLSKESQLTLDTRLISCKQEERIQNVPFITLCGIKF